MDKQRKREIGRVILHSKPLNKQVKEWEKVIGFLEKRKGINEGRDRLIKEAHIERNKIRDKIKELLRKLKE